MRKRKQLINWLFEKSQVIYTKWFKTNQPWGICKEDLLKYPNDSFGKYLGLFLQQNNFDLIPKVERHDCYHVITGYGITVEEEIAQQYLCYGNGKRSLYLFGVIILGTLILPEYLKFYLDSYKIGKKANTFHNLDFKGLLNISLVDLQFTIFSSMHLKSIK